MNRTTLLAATLLGIFVTTASSAAEDLAIVGGCDLRASSIEARLAVSRLARIHGKTRNYSPRLTHQLERSWAAQFPWHLAGNSATTGAAVTAVCTRCEP